MPVYSYRYTRLAYSTDRHVLLVAIGRACGDELFGGVVLARSDWDVHGDIPALIM
ncbi:hypothetical protein GOD70_31550 [Sinorhizobium medicae]|nr:hypothetical protein [Sinorhizobium medicae]